MNKIIEEQLGFILASCRAYVVQSKKLIKDKADLPDEYGFLVSVGSNLAAIRNQHNHIEEQVNKIKKLCEQRLNGEINDYTFFEFTRRFLDVEI